MNARGLKGEKRPADVIGNAVHIMRIATGEIAEENVHEGRSVEDIANLVETAAPVPATPLQ